MAQSTATPAKVVAAAQRDLGKPGPTNTCVSNGLQRFAREAGAPLLVRPDGTPTASITEARKLGAAGVNGWRYHDGLDGVQPGDQVDWAKPAGIFHVSTVIEVRRSGGRVVALRTIGSGGPTQVINWQPASSGWNDVSYFRGWWRMPYAGTSKVVAKKPAPAAAKQYATVQKGEGGIAFAARVKVPLGKLKGLNADVKDWGKLALGQKIRIK